jgi:acetyltransferase
MSPSSPSRARALASHEARAAMSTRNLEGPFHPRHVAVVAAGGERSGLGQIVLRNLVDAGFDRVVSAVNPRREAVAGVQAYPTVADLPSRSPRRVHARATRMREQNADRAHAAWLQARVQISSGTISIAPHGHSSAHMPQPLQ